jgi:hypothetical protein
VVLITFDATDPAALSDVVDYDLQHYIPIPVTAAAPVTGANRGDVEVTVVWKDEQGGSITPPFAEGATYQAEIEVKAQPGWSFDPARNFAYPAGSVAAQPAANPAANIRNLTVIYKTTTGPTAITTVGNLAVYISAPESGATAVRSFAAGQYNGTVTWQYKDGQNWLPMPGSRFQPDTEYKAGVILYPAPGYMFDAPNTLGLAYNSLKGGLDPVAVPGIQSDGSITGIGIGFDPTEEIPVSDWDLTLKVPQPVKGSKAGTIISSVQYTGTVSWYPDTPDPAVNGFQAGEDYTATVTLTAASGYTFTGVSSFTHGALNGGNITTLSNNGDTAAFAINFPPVPTDTTVTDLDLTARVPRPVTGDTPVPMVFGTQYTGAVTWKITGGADLSTGFQGGTFYTATVTLSAAPGYTFTGLSGPFTHGGASSGGVSIDDNTGALITVSIAFPATAGSVTAAAASFGSTKASPDSALFHMDQRKDGDPLTINLSAATEALTEDVVITRAAGAVNTPRNVTINGGGRVLNTADSKLTLTGDGTEDGLIVTLTNITIQGGNGISAPLVRIEGKARLILGHNAAIRGGRNTSTANYGGGVYIGTGSGLEMRAGSKIRDNHNTDGRGGGVYNNGGTLTMNAGSEIYDNQAQTGGGVYQTADSVFVLGGGRIYDNISEENGGGVYVAGAGTFFEMSGGEIFGNSGIHGCGVYLAGNAYGVMSGGRIYNHVTDSGNGGGVYVAGSVFEMSGGAIADNTANSYGGGVYADSGAVFRMSGGTVSNNAAETNGGGVYVKDADFEMRNSGIFDNTLSGDTEATGGAGVTVYNYTANQGTFTMKNGAKIYNNKALKGKDGGGVLVYSDDAAAGGAFTMESGSQVYNNTALGGGGGVTVKKGTFTMKNGSSITGNTTTDTVKSTAGGLYLDDATAAVAGLISANNIAAGAAKSGGGVYVGSTGDFTLKTGGKISSHIMTMGAESGGGVRNDGQFTMEDGFIEKNKNTASAAAAGVYNNGTFDMSGGSIFQNEVTADASGGGVYNNGTFNMSGGKVDGNKVAGKNAGGGVYNNTLDALNPLYFFEMSGSSSIENNEVTGSNAGGGGGVYNNSPAVFKMSGSNSKIQANKATVSSTPDIAVGAAAGVYNAGTFQMTAGRIRANVATGTYVAGGVHNSGIFTLGEDALADASIEENTAKGQYTAAGVRTSLAASEFNMNGGSISGNRIDGSSYTYAGGGVYVHGGTFTLTAGSISGNFAGANYSGGGVYNTAADGTGGFKMEGGSISGNFAGAASGGGVYNSSTFTMEGGDISNNGTTGSNAGGGVYNAKDFTMSGGYIKENEAEGSAVGGGVYNTSPTTGTGYFKMDSGSTGSTEQNTATAAGTSLWGGAAGVYNASNGTFEMFAGSIHHNTVTGQYGAGGVHNKGSFTLGEDDSADASIEFNEAVGANSGGGVRTYSGTFIMNGGSISGNLIDGAYSDSGGGVHVASGTSFTLNAGGITGNKAETSTNSGGGVHVHGGTFDMKGGSISGNFAGNNSGGGVNVAGSSAYFEIEALGCLINNNKAGTDSGGGARANSGYFRVQAAGGGEMTNNTAEPGGSNKSKGGVLNVNGGAAWVKYNGSLIIHDNDPDTSYTP